LKEEFEELYYYGVIMMAHSIITIFKNNLDISVTSVDINVIHNWCSTNLANRTKDSPLNFWQEMCLPGMTEDFMLPVYFNYYPDENQASELKIIYVCEEQNSHISEKLSEISRQIFIDF
jgi:hypothetical protein